MQGWQAVQAEALRRIQSREWPPGGLIPNEAALAREWGCARATVNRALQALAEDGWLERRRRAGTRVALSPQRRAQMAVPVLAREIEAQGKVHTHELLEKAREDGLLRLRTLHRADGVPYALENREIDLARVPDAAGIDFTAISANEWLVSNAPFDNGTMTYSAEPAGSAEARHLDCAEGTPLLTLTRRTFSEDGPITLVRMAYAPGHAVTMVI